MLSDLLLKNRSIRVFKPGEKVPADILLEMINCTRLCPSTANLQALKFRPVYIEDECKTVFENIKWAGYLAPGTVPPKGHESSNYIIICNDKDIAANTEKFFKDTGICAQSMMLCAVEKGYGGCMIGSFDKEKISKELNIPSNLEITLILALGVPEESPEIVDANGDIKYYRENGVNYVPKRTLEEIIIK